MCWPVKRKSLSIIQANKFIKRAELLQNWILNTQMCTLPSPNDVTKCREITMVNETNRLVTDRFWKPSTGGYCVLDNKKSADFRTLHIFPITANAFVVFSSQKKKTTYVHVHSSYVDRNVLTLLSMGDFTSTPVYVLVRKNIYYLCEYLTK